MIPGCVCNLNDLDYFIKLPCIVCTGPYFPADISQEQTKIEFGISVLYDTQIQITKMLEIQTKVTGEESSDVGRS